MIVAAVLAATVVSAPAGADFDDVPDGQFYTEAVDWLVDQDITTGSPAGSSTFKPNDEVTRGEFATFLWRFAGEPTGGANDFVDVPAGAFYNEAVGWLVANDITTGSPAGSNTFKPLDPVNRAEIATFIWRYFCKPPAADNDPFGDVAGGSFYETPVNWFFDEGLTTGTSPTTYSPFDLSTRAQTGTFLHRLAGEPPVGDPGDNRTYDCDDGPVVPGESSLVADGAITIPATGVDDPPSTTTVTFTNDGDDDAADIEVTSIGLVGNAALTLSDAPAVPLLLEPGETFDVTISFDPTASGTVSATLTVEHDGANGDFSEMFSATGTTSSTTGNAAFIGVSEDFSGNINASTFSFGSFRIENTSTSAEIEEIAFDMSTGAIPGIVFDPDDGTPAGDPDAKDFTVDKKPGGADPTATYELPINDGFRRIVIDADDFAPGEELEFSIDIDPWHIKGATPPGPNESGSVSGFELIGTTVTVDFSSGPSLTGRIFPDGSVGAGVLALNGTTPPAEPTVSVSAGPGAARTVTIAGGTPGAAYELIQMDVGLWTTVAGAAPGALDGNSVVGSSRDTGVLDGTGGDTVNVTLRSTTVGGNENPGLNYFVVKSTFNGRTSVSDVAKVDLSP